MKIWSKSKKAWLPIEEMILPHARNTLAKLQRGEYRDEAGEIPELGTHLELEGALQARIAELEAALVPADPQNPDDEVPGA